ncbi:MAG: hypothetical protein AAF585_10565 [Verrucomicrobiota bacterium]
MKAVSVGEGSGNPVSNGNGCSTLLGRLYFVSSDLFAMPEDPNSTRWAAIADALRSKTGRTRSQARDQLAKQYSAWCMRYFQARGFDPHEAEDLTQSFFQKRILSNDWDIFRKAKEIEDRDSLTSLRAYLKAAIRYHEIDYRRDIFRRRQIAAGEDNIDEPMNLSPEEIAEQEAVFDLSWVEDLFDKAWVLLEAVYTNPDDAKLLAVGKEVLLGLKSNQDAARELDLPESTLSDRLRKNKVSGLEQAFLVRVRELIYQTLHSSNREDLEAEWAFVREIWKKVQENAKKPGSARRPLDP